MNNYVVTNFTFNKLLIASNCYDLILVAFDMKFDILRNVNVFEILILVNLKVWLYFTLLMFSYFLSTSFLIFLSHRHIVNDSMKIFLKIFLSCSVVIDSTYFWNMFGASFFKISACFDTFWIRNDLPMTFLF